AYEHKCIKEGRGGLFRVIRGASKRSSVFRLDSPDGPCSRSSLCMNGSLHCPTIPAVWHHRFQPARTRCSTLGLSAVTFSPLLGCNFLSIRALVSFLRNSSSQFGSLNFG